MARSVAIIIPGAPTGKGRPRATVRNGHARTYTPKETRSRESIVAALAMQQMAGAHGFDVPVAVTIEFVMPVPESWALKKKLAALRGEIRPTSKPDLDNMIKLVTDGMNGIVYLDDRLITSMTASKTYGAEPRTAITVAPADAAAVRGAA